MDACSVIVSTYNASKFLERTLSGFRFQTYPHELIEIIIVDDGSNDDTERMIKYFECPIRIRHFKQEHLGYRLSTLRNLALENSQYDIIIQLDCDMIPSPNLVDSHIRWFDKIERAAVIGSRKFVDVNSFNSLLEYDDLMAISKLDEVRSSSNWFLTTDRRVSEFAKFETHPAPFNLFHGCNVAYRKKDAIKCGLYDEDFNYHWGYEDIEFGYRLWKDGVKLIYEKEAQAYHQENDVISFEQKQKDDLINFEKACSKIPEFREFKKKINLSDRKPFW